MADFKVDALLPREYQTQRQKADLLSKKWERTGLLEGLKDVQRGNMAQLLENQASQLVTEANQTSTTVGSEEWNGIALPLVRRIFGEIVAKEFVSVQPMNMPSGLVFFLDYKYASSQPGFLTNQGRTSQADSIFGITDATKGYAPGNEGLYGAGRFGYSMNDYSSSALQPHTTLTNARFLTGSVDWKNDLNQNSEFSASAAAAGYKLVKVFVSSSALTNPDLDGVRAFTLANSVGTFVNDTFQEFTSYNATTKRLSFIVSASGLAGTSRLVVNYHKQPTSITRGDFEAGKTQQSTTIDAPLDIPTLDLQFRQESIVAKTRQLKAQWTPQFAQDIVRYQNIDAEAELTGMLSEYVSHEIDLEILDMLIRDAQTTKYWSMRLGYEWNGSTFGATASNVAAYTQGTWFQTLGTKIQAVSNEIHRLTLRGGANFLVTSPTIATILESIPGFASSGTGPEQSFAFGVQKVGMFNSRYTVYKNPYMTENAILMGYRGSNWFETGAVYSPYIPLIMTPVVLDPDNFTPRRGVMTRYAKKMLRPEFYGKIYVEGLNTL